MASKPFNGFGVHVCMSGSVCDVCVSVSVCVRERARGTAQQKPKYILKNFLEKKTLSTFLFLTVSAAKSNLASSAGHDENTTPATKTFRF